MAVLLEFDLSNIRELSQRFDPKIVDRALNRTLNVMQRKVRVVVSKDVRAFYNISAGRIKKDLSLKRTIEGGKPGRMLLYVGPRIGLPNFSGKVKTVRVQAVSNRGSRFSTRRQATYYRATRGAGQKRAQHKTGAYGFSALLNNGNIHFAARLGNGKLQALKGPSVAHMVNRNTERKVLALLGAEMAPEFNRNMAFDLGRQVGLY